MPPSAGVTSCSPATRSTASCPFVVPSPLIVAPDLLERIPHQQGTDYAYLTQLAGEAGYVFYVEPGRFRDEHGVLGARRSGSARRSRRSA